MCRIEIDSDDIEQALRVRGTSVYGRNLIIDLTVGVMWSSCWKLFLGVSKAQSQSASFEIHPHFVTLSQFETTIKLCSIACDKNVTLYLEDIRGFYLRFRAFRNSATDVLCKVTLCSREQTSSSPALLQKFCDSKNKNYQMTFSWIVLQV
jgi:hypothetical protein